VRQNAAVTVAFWTVRPVTVAFWTVRLVTVAFWTVDGLTVAFWTVDGLTVAFWTELNRKGHVFYNILLHNRAKRYTIYYIVTLYTISLHYNI